MSAATKKSQYTIARVLHWAAGIIIIFNLLSGWRLGGFPLETKQMLLMIHSGVGTVIFLVMLFRWWWRRTNKLYVPPRWWKRPSMLLQWVLYPLTLLQAVIGVTLAGFIDYEVVAFGFIPYSDIATDNEGLQAFFLQLHAINAWLLIVLIVAHFIERWRMIFIDDVKPASVQEPASP
jgi:cytochrome b561